jgi:plastocyanin
VERSCPPRIANNQSLYQYLKEQKTMQRKVSISTVVILVLLGVTLSVTSRHAVAADKSPAAVEVKIDNFSFGPETITVKPGTQVTWTNQDDIPHTVTSDDLITFKSHPLDTDDKFSFTFTKPGTYSYFCSLHPKMTAKVVVR